MEKIEVVTHITFVDPMTKKSHDLDLWRSVEDPLFKAVDVAKLIDYSQGNTEEMLRMIDSYEKIHIGFKDILTPSKVRVQSRGGPHHGYWFLTEYGLYEVLFQSNKPIAKRFRLYIKEILHDIRKHHNWKFIQEDINYYDDKIWYDEENHVLCRTIGIDHDGDPVGVFLHDGSSEWVYEDGEPYESWEEWRFGRHD